MRGLVWMVGVSVVAAAVVITVRGVMGDGAPARSPAPGACPAGRGASTVPRRCRRRRADRAGRARPTVEESKIEIVSTPAAVEVFEGDRGWAWRRSRSSRRR